MHDPALQPLEPLCNTLLVFPVFPNGLAKAVPVTEQDVMERASVRARVRVHTNAPKTPGRSRSEVSRLCWLLEMQ